MSAILNPTEPTRAAGLTARQQEAIVTRGNLLVVAGAGTGKTRTLVARCLRLLCEEGASLERILMVTFTEAAAAEMRSRIRQELRALQATRPTDEHLAQQLALLDAARISTLHSFCLQLIREHFQELGLDPQFGVLDEKQIRPLMHSALDQLLERHYSSNDSAARAVQSLIRAVGRGSDQRIRKLVIKLHKYSQSLPDPALWLQEQQRRFQTAEPTEWRQWLITAVLEWRDEWKEIIAPFAADAAAVRLSCEALNSVSANCSLEQAVAAVKAVLAANDDRNWPYGTKGKVRDLIKGFFADAEFLEEMLPADGKDPLAEDWEWTRHHLSALISLTREFTSAFSRAKRELGGLDFADLEQGALQLLADPAIAAQWRAQLDHIFVDEYQDINEAQDRIITALSREVAPSTGNRFLVGDVKQSIYRFRLANPKIFSDYAESWSVPDAEGRRISLTENFRSREALLEFINPLFAALMRKEIGGVNYEPLEFGASERRSALAIQPNAAPQVEFHLIARAEDELVTVDESEESSRTPTADLLGAEREARLLAWRFREMKDAGFPVWDESEARFRPVRWGDMAVLLRSPAGRAEAFAMEFDRAGVPLSAARDGFFESLEVSDLLNLLKLLDNPLQDVPLLAVLRSPLVGLSPDELVAVRAHSNATPFWTALMVFHREAAKQQIAEKPASIPAGKPSRTARGKREQQPISELPLFSHYQPRETKPDAPVPNGTPATSAWLRIDVFLKQFARWRELVRQVSLSHCLETALVETHYEALLMADDGSRSDRGVERCANVRRLLDLARQFDPYQRQGLYRFLRFVEAQQDSDLDLPTASPPAADAVQLMSVHKSKGLEFPVVALVCLGTRFNEQDLGEPVLLSERYGLCPKITPPHVEQNYQGLAHWLARRSERRELRGEELRMLYVALTRARDALILVGSDHRTITDLNWDEPAQPELAPELAAPSPSPDDEGEKSETAIVPGALARKHSPGPVSTREIVQARSPLDWLLAWLPHATTKEQWTDEQRGQNQSLRWKIYDENDPVFDEPIRTAAESTGARAGDRNDAESAERVKAILAWQYPFAAATTEAAKSTVSILRRRQQEEEGDEASRWFQFRYRRKKSGLSAAEIGNAHHLFMQFVSLEKLGAGDVSGEAERLGREGRLSAEEIHTLDLTAITAFWKSPVGRRILEQHASVQREIPFTARFSTSDLAAAGVNLNLAAEEFVVVQGVVDLAVILPESIWLVDFKTDALKESEVTDKARWYEPQLKLYALALSRIYERPVTECGLYFLSPQKWVPVAPVVLG